MATVYKRSESPIWQAKITVGGVVRRISTKKRTRSEAQREADAIEKRENDALLAAETASIGLVEAAAQYFAMKTDKLRPKTVDCYNTSLSNIYGTLGDFPLNSLNIPGIRDYIAKRMSGDKPATVAVRQDLAFLSALISHAMVRDTRIVKNPLLKWAEKKDLVPKAKARDTPFKPEEIERLLAACTEMYQKLFIPPVREHGNAIRRGPRAALGRSELYNQNDTSAEGEDEDEEGSEGLPER